MGFAERGNRSASRWRLASLGLLLLASLMPLLLLRGKSVTLDEVSHVAAGYSYLRTHEIVLNPMHPPLIKELCALPLLLLDLEMPVDAETLRRRGSDMFYQWRFGADFLRTQGAERVLLHSRPVAVLLSVGLATVILLWATELWGRAGGAFALFLYVFDPTITAHAQLVTTDVPFAFFATLFLYRLRAVLLSPSWGRALFAGICLGLALAAKFSAVILIPVAALLSMMASFAPAGKPRPDLRPGIPPLRLLVSDRSVDRLLGAAGLLSVMALVAGVVVWTAYFFPSDPSFYVRGLSLVEADHAPSYYHFYMGEFSKGTWPSYFLVAWLVKTPLPELALIALSVILFVRGERAHWLEEAFLLVPLVVLFVGYASFAQPIGVRYVIPCYPFLYIFAGRAAILLARGALARLTLVAALVWSVVEFAAIWPDHLPYFIQIAGGWRGGIRWLDDSSIDWGQSLLELREYLAKRSIRDYTLCTAGNADIGEFYGLKAGVVWLDKLLEPPPGVLIMSSHCVARMTAFLEQRFGDGPQNWLAHVAPEDVIGHTYYVYEIPAGS